MCYKAEEHTKHNDAGYMTLAPSEHANGHNEVADYIHQTTCKHVGLLVTDMYHEHIPERVINVKGTTIICDLPVITDGTVPANRPDILLHGKKREDLPTDGYSLTG